MNDEILVMSELKDIKKSVKTIEHYFAEGKVRLTKDCLQNATNGSKPVLYREFKNLRKMVWWLVGITVSSGGLVAGGYSIASLFK